MTTEPPLEEFLRLACLGYADDGPERWAAARRVLADHPELPAASIHVAAAVADSTSVASLLARDPASVNAPGGPHAWEPLLYLTYSRVDPGVEKDAVLRTASLLLDAGADPNAGYLWHGLPSPFTALTGALGEGEAGPVRQPRHPHDLALARLLLERGADPNDSQGLYNRMFTPDNAHLELLFEFGLGTGDGGPWRQRLGDALMAPAALLHYQLGWAVAHDMTARVRLLLAHGVDVRAPFTDGTTAVERAARRGCTEVVDALVAAGATPAELAPADALVAAVLAEDFPAADAVIAGSPGALETARASRTTAVLEATAARRPASVRRFVELGFDVNAKAPPHRGWPAGATALHEAVSGDADLVRLLVDLGADPNIRDDEFDATPLGWAEYGYATEAAAVLAPLTLPSEQTDGP